MTYAVITACTYATLTSVVSSFAFQKDNLQASLSRTSCKSALRSFFRDSGFFCFHWIYAVGFILIM
jgi:hypothetical protein